MSGYLGGNPRRVHLLDSQDIENIVRHFDLKELRGDIKSVSVALCFKNIGFSCTAFITLNQIPNS